MERHFRFIDRWQTSLERLFPDRPDRDLSLRLLEDRDQQLEEFLTVALQETDFADTNPARARVSASAVQSMPNAGAGTPFTFDTTNYDKVPDNPAAFHFDGTDKLICQSGHNGLYAVGGIGAFAANATGLRDVSLLVNGTTYIATHRDPTPSGTNASRLGCSTEWEFVAGDYVQLIGYQNSGAALNSAVLLPTFPQMYWRKVAATA